MSNDSHDFPLQSPMASWDSHFPEDASDSVSFKELMFKATKSLEVVMEEEEDDDEERGQETRLHRGGSDRTTKSSIKRARGPASCSLHCRHSACCHGQGGVCLCCHTRKMKRKGWKHLSLVRPTPTPKPMEPTTTSLIGYLHAQNKRDSITTVDSELGSNFCETQHH